MTENAATDHEQHEGKPGLHPLTVLLIFVPISIGLKFFAPHSQGFQIALFVCACLAVLPLAGQMGHATGELAKHLGPTVGALLNSTFGNAAELILTILALKAGLLDMVQASLTGSIIGNILLVLGLALLAGGWKRPAQHFNRTLVSMHTTSLLLAVAGLMVPAIFVHAHPGLAQEHAGTRNPAVWNLSLAVSGVLITLYLLGLFFTLKTHHAVFNRGDEAETPHWTKKRALTTLAVATGFVAWMAEILVHTVEPMTEALGLSPIFVGVIVIPLIGNAAENSSAIGMAMQNKMDIAFGIAVGASMQIALFVAPLLVFISALFGQHLSLIFTSVELVALAFAVAIVALVAHDGETHWLEGAQLLAVYVIIALAFLLVPPASTVHVPAPAH
jgi:Ca2+:H+ antiporter